MSTVSLLLFVPQYFSDGPVATITHNLLVQHVDRGNGLVMAMQGSALVDIYPYALTTINPSTDSCSASMTITTAGHNNPITNGTLTFKGSTNMPCASFSVTDPDILTQSKMNTKPMVLVKTFTFNSGAQVRRVDLNFFPFPGSNGTNGHGWDATTDGYKLMARSMLWAAHAID